MITRQIISPIMNPMPNIIKVYCNEVNPNVLCPLSFTLLGALIDNVLLKNLSRRIVKAPRHKPVIIY